MRTCERMWKGRRTLFLVRRAREPYGDIDGD